MEWNGIINNFNKQLLASQINISFTCWVVEYNSIWQNNNNNNKNINNNNKTTITMKNSHSETEREVLLARQVLSKKIKIGMKKQIRANELD